MLAGATFTGEVIFNSTGSLQLPAGTTAQRPGSPTNADIRYNSDNHEVEAYKNGSWSDIGSAAKGGSTDAIFYENGQAVTADYTITNGQNAGSFGPITINSGVTVTIGTGETWTVV